MRSPGTPCAHEIGDSGPACDRQWNQRAGEGAGAVIEFRYGFWRTCVDSTDVRADRQLSILLLSQVQRRLTARELAKRLEVAERTILRDMGALAELIRLNSPAGRLLSRKNSSRWLRDA